MTLPNFFLADLPPEASLTPTLVREACQTLKRNREQHLVTRPTAQVIKVLSDLAANWMEPDYPLRRLALAQGPEAAGFPAATLARGLDAFFGQLTREHLQAWVQQELGHAQRLDGLAATEPETRRLQAAMARGPELLVHIAAGNVPSPAWMSMVGGLLVRSAQFVKCARGASLLPRLFAHSLHEAEPKLAACLEIAEWPGGEAPLEEPLFEEASCVTVTGSDETLAELRGRLPLRVRFLGYGHRVSFGFVAQEALDGYGVDRWIQRAAEDVVAWNQQGCLSPHLFYVQSGGSMSAEGFAEALAAEMARLETVEPRGPLPVAESAGIASRREFYQVRAAASRGTRLWCSEGSTAWTVVYEEDPLFQLSCLNRFVYVKGVADLAEALREAEPVREHLSTVGVAAAEGDAEELALSLARWGVRRVCPLGRMQHPPLSWRHDGRPGLADLVTWTDWER
jgi:hypothetical protein